MSTRCVTDDFLKVCDCGLCVIGILCWTSPLSEVLLIFATFRKMALLLSSGIGCHYTDSFFIGFYVSNKGQDGTRHPLNIILLR
jgi:hypothetical protein